MDILLQTRDVLDISKPSIYHFEANNKLTPTPKPKSARRVQRNTNRITEYNNRKALHSNFPFSDGTNKELADLLPSSHVDNHSEKLKLRTENRDLKL